MQHSVHFELSGKKIRLLGIAVSAFIIIYVLVHWNLYLDPDLELSYGPALLAVSIIAGLAACPLICVRAWVDEKYKFFANTALFFILPIFSMQMVECFNSKFIWNFSCKTGLANYMIYLVFYLACFMITRRYHMTGLIINISLYVWALLNYFIETFRGTPFVPMDILSFKTGLSVSDGYTYELSWQLILGSIIFFLIYLINKRSVNMKPAKLRGKLLINSLSGAYLAIVVLSFFFTSFSQYTGYKPDFWNQSRGYHRTGSFFNFCLNTKYLYVGKPSGYDASTVADYVNQTLEDYGVDPDGDTCTNILTGENDYTASTDGTTPNIIFIMNESFSDPGILGDLETNEDYMPFIHNLTENTIKGYVHIPVFGAGTSNSEFEALTGDTISFLPSGCNVYQSYIKQETPSIVSTLKTLGYSETAYHPYYGDGWNRENVYPLLGFEDFISIEDFIDEDILENYKQSNDVTEYEAQLKARYPDRDMLLRRFVSDSYDYSMVEDMFEEKNEESDDPTFIFNVTMQNHGGYAVSYSNFFQQIYTTNLSQSYPKANRYLSLVKESDEAFEELLEYFSNVDEPTIICMFGDHYPSIEDEFYEELFGNSLDSLTAEQDQAEHATPFIIWANYDIDEATDVNISSNYLSTLLQQVAGLPMTQYNKYLATICQTLPVIDTVGYVDADGNYYSSASGTSFETLLNQYQCIQYNELLDKKNRDDSLFYLDTDSGETSE